MPSNDKPSSTSSQNRSGYGFFREDGQEFVVTRPDPPMPWVNVLTNQSYGLLLSQAGGGYSWLTHASLNRITRWEQDLVRDDWGKYIYLRDRDSGEYWSPTWQPCGQAAEAYQVRHGRGYSIIESRHGQLSATLTVFVPLDDPCEVWQLRLENQGGSERNLQVFTYLEWLLGAAPDWHREFHRLFIRTWYHRPSQALLASKVLWEVPGESGPHWNRTWPYVAFHAISLPVSGFDAYKRAFLGRNGSLRAPLALEAGRSQDTEGAWGDAIASLQAELRVPAGGQVEVTFSLGAVEREELALELVEKYKRPQAAQKALQVVQSFWQELSDELVVQTPDPALNWMANTWLPYQAIAGRLWGRSAYYQTGGAFGFRDQLQDSLVWLLLGRPENTLAQIHLHAAHQFQEGIVLHWWHPLAESGLRSEYSDDLLWLPFVVLRYLEETGDLDCLQAEIPFYDEGSATLLEHCLRAFEVALGRRSERGLPLILKGDWNDGLNAVGAQGRGESAWMACFLYFLLTRWADLPVLAESQAARFRDEAESLRAATNAYAWDGEWYWRATTDAGERIGSARNQQGQIFLNPQTWAVLSGLAPDERAGQALASARQRLYTSYGALLLAPAYSVPDPHIGYLTRYAPGTRENGGVYVHAACWAVLAERKLHGAEAAYRLWRSFCPPRRGLQPEVYWAEPYVMPGNVDGPDSQFEGRGGWTWYTGSGAWYLRALVEGVLGVESTLDGLKVDAALPDEWDQFQVLRRFRGAAYVIKVRRAGEGELPGCRVDGARWEADLLPFVEPGATVQVEFLVPGAASRPVQRP